jgi:hypothetical protein
LTETTSEAYRFLSRQVEKSPCPLEIQPMILLSNTDSLLVDLLAAPTTSNPFFYASYFDVTPDLGVITYGDVPVTQLNGTTDIAVIPSPPNAATTRQLAAFMLVNTDTAALTVRLLLGTNVLCKFLLSVGDNLSYSRTDGVFRILDQTGSLKQTVLLPTNVALTNTTNTFNGTQTFAGLIIPSASGLQGTILANSAPAGSIGEVISATLLTASSIALTSVTSANVTSMSLTAGDWDVDGRVVFTVAATTTMGYLSGGINTVSATLPLNNAGVVTHVGAGTNATIDVTVEPVLSLSSVRVSIAATTTVYLVARAKFATSTCRAYGAISARRVR